MVVFVGCLGVAGSVGCAAEPTRAEPTATSGTGAGTPGEGGAASDGGGGTGGTQAHGTGAGGDGTDWELPGTGGAAPVTPPAKLYVHSGTTLFEGDPAAEPVVLTDVGDFDCVGGDGQDYSMTDVAVSAGGDVWGISVRNVYRLEIGGGVAHCAQTIPLENPNDIRFYGLSFAPAGVLGDEEVLVAGNTAGELWSIGTDGELALLGHLGTVPPNDGNGNGYEHAGKRWELSGDIAFAGGPDHPIGFATVRDCPNPPSPSGCNPVDTLLELDLDVLATAGGGSVTKAVRGQVKKRPDCSDPVSGDYGAIYGIAVYEDRVLGFSRLADNAGGYSIDIRNVDGGACLVPGTASGTAWVGAGITTTAPVIAPPPK